MLAQPITDPQPDLAAEAAERRRIQHAALDDLLDLTMSAAHMVHDRAKMQEAITPPDSDAHPAADIALPLDRLARAARLTILLSQQIDAPVRQRTGACRRILRAVEDTIHREKSNPSEREPLQAELHERLDRLDLDELGHRRIAEIVADICRDLGLVPPLPGQRPYKRRTPADITLLDARAAYPGHPGPTNPGPTNPGPSNPADDPERVFRLVATPNGGA